MLNVEWRRTYNQDVVSHVILHTLGNCEKWKKLFSVSVSSGWDVRCQVCTLRWFSETETRIHLQPFMRSFRLTRWATVFWQIIQFARFHVNHRSAVSFEVNTWRCRIKYCCCDFISKSIFRNVFRVRYIGLYIPLFLRYFGAQVSLISWAVTSSSVVVGRLDVKRALNGSQREDGL
jgi:hypothetical protein